MSRNKAADAQRLIDAATRMAVTIGVTEELGYQLLNRMDEFQVHTLLEERDFDQPVVVVGNWNSVDRWDNELRKSVELSDLPKRLGDALEKIGVELAWGDCTITCDDCYKLLNTEPTHYGWQPHYAIVSDECVCQSCLDAEDYLAELEGGECFNNVGSVHPEDHGYFPLATDLQRGLHSGMDADPDKIAKLLSGKKIERFLFNTDDVSQLYSTFSVWVHVSEVHKLLVPCAVCAAGQGHDDDEPHFREGFSEDDCDEADQDELGVGEVCTRPSSERTHVLRKLTDMETQGPSVSEALKRGLQNASLAAAALPEGGVKYVRIDGDKVAEARTISPEEFAQHGVGKPKE
jgi:hypothetical protein